MTFASLIICTRNRVRDLALCLDKVASAAAFFPQNDAELVVVDNGSADGTEAAVREWSRSAPISVQVLREPRPGLAVARNTGARAARGAILAFTDDDCRPDVTYFRELHRLFQDTTRPAIRGGRVNLGDPTDIPFTIKTDDRPEIYSGERHPGGFVHGCNMAATRTVFERIGDFDERFGPGAPFESGEDTDFIYRAHLAGIAVEYVPSLVVAHYHGRKTRAEILKLNRAYTRANGALYLKFIRHWELLRNLAWDVKGSAREVLGGEIMNAELGFTYRANVWGCVRGMWRFATFRDPHARPPLPLHRIRT